MGCGGYHRLYCSGLLADREADRLADQYHVPKDKIVIEPKPHGCDFDDAPLGNKHCHYEKSVDVARGCPAPDCQVAAVYVSWKKVDE